MSSVVAVDLAQLPFRPSRVLTAWNASRKQERQAAQAARERRAQMAQFRRIGGSAAPRQSAGIAATLPQPALPVAQGERAFAAAGIDRLSAGWTTFSTGINADLEASLTILQARSQDWAQNTDIGERYIALVCDNVVGHEPPRLQVRCTFANGNADERLNAAVEGAWRQWGGRGCEITGQLSFAAVCRQNVAAAARDGEFLSRRIRSRSLPFGYALQLLDANRIDTAMNVAPPAAGGSAVRMGIEIDALGRPTAAWLQERHPGDPSSMMSPRGISKRVDMKDLFHGFVHKRPEQIRGYPWAAPVLKRANTLDAYEQYALVAAKIGAAKMGFYTVDKEAVDPDDMSWAAVKDATGNLVQDVEAGMLEALPPGVGFESFDPDYPHQNFGPFVTQSQLGISAGLNVAHHNLSGNMTGVNYSSARIAELSERRHWRALQRWFIDAFVMPCFLDWLQAALISGAVRYPNGTVIGGDRFAQIAEAATFQPPGWAWVDPKADIDAAITAAGADVRSLRQICDEQGVDLDDVLADNKQLFDRYEQLGLPVPLWLSRKAAPTAPAAAEPAEPSAGDEPKPKEEAAA